MLLGILPGLRELRTPLAAGYLLLATLFLLTYESLVTSVRENPTLKSFVQALAYFGPAGTIAIATFAAFLLGSVWSEIFVWLAIEAPPRLVPFLRKNLSRYRHPSRSQSLTRFERLKFLLMALMLTVIRRLRGNREEARPTQDFALRELIIATMKEGYRSNSDFRVVFRKNAEKLKVARRNEEDDEVETEELDEVIRINEHLMEIARDLPRLPVHLLGRDQEIWNAWDRTKSEAEFRVATAFALLVASIAAMIKFSFWWVLVFPVPVILLMLGLQKSRASYNTLRELVITGRFPLSSMELLKSPAYIHWKTEARYRQMFEESPDLKLP